MSEDDEKHDQIFHRPIQAKWPCGHELVNVHVKVTRTSTYRECPYCLLAAVYNQYYENGTLDKEILEMIKRTVDNA